MKWMDSLWKPARPYCLSRVEIVFTGAKDGSTGPLPPMPFTVAVVIAQDPKEGLGEGYFEIAEVPLEMDGEFVAPRTVFDVPWPFGPRILPAGWWVGVRHDCPDFLQDTLGSDNARMSVQLHGCFV